MEGEKKEKEKTKKMEKKYYLSKLLPIAAYMCISCCMLGYYKPGYKEDNEGARTGGEGKGYIATALRIKIKFRRHNLPPNFRGRPCMRQISQSSQIRPER